MRPPNLSFLTTLRFFAALWVFIFHIHKSYPLPLPEFWANIIGQGAVGMSLFFILSGFILTYNYYDAQPIQDFKGFMVKRLARIYPVYLFTALLSLPLMPILGNTFSKVLVIGLDTLLLQAWFPHLFSHWNNASSWSLSNEFFFYLTFPILLWIFHKTNSKQQFTITLFAYLLCLLPPLVGQYVPPFGDFVTLYSLPVYRLPEFIIGIAAGFLYKNKPPTFGSRNVIMVIIILSLLFLELGLVGDKLYFWTGHNFIVIPAFATIIYLCANWKFKCFTHLGKASYSFYLLQVIPLSLVHRNFSLLKENIPFLENPFFLLAFTFVITQAFASLSYICLETPARKLIISLYEKNKGNSEKGSG